MQHIDSFYCSYYRQLLKRIGKREILYWGTRGTDATGLLELPSFQHIFSLIAPLNSTRSEFCLESRCNERVDLDSYSIDLDIKSSSKTSKAAVLLWQNLLKTLKKDFIILPYSSCDVLSSAWFTRSGKSKYAGLFFEKQNCFEHKPWVENCLNKYIKTIHWDYYADNEFELLERRKNNGSIVLRSNRSNGGRGLSLVEKSSKLHRAIPMHEDLFIGVSEYLHPNIPINIGGCIFPNKIISLHAPSIQLIGLNEMTKRRFGYCGNDFAAIPHILTKGQISQLEEMTRTVGSWLHQEGYLGAFGIDALLHNDDLYFVELNPRFQGSSAISVNIDADHGRPNIFINHLAAHLGLDAPKEWEKLSLFDICSSSNNYSHIIVHNIGVLSQVIAENHSINSSIYCELIPENKIQVHPEGILFKCVLNKSVTDDGLVIKDKKVLNKIKQIKTELVKRRGPLFLPGMKSTI